jgi:hypothetical protein
MKCLKQGSNTVHAGITMQQQCDHQGICDVLEAFIK